MPLIKWMLTPVGGQYYDLDRNGRRVMVSVSEAEAERYVRSKSQTGQVLQRKDTDGYIIPWRLKKRSGRK